MTELRPAWRDTLEEANRVLGAFLPRFKARFGVPAAQPGSAYRRLSPALDLDGVLCFHYQGTAALDNTVRFGGRTLQLLAGLDRLSYAHAQVEVQERLDGGLVVQYQGTILATGPAPPTAPTLRARNRSLPHPPAPPKTPPTQATHPQPSNGVKPHIPAPNHPWRKTWMVTNHRTVRVT